MYRRTYHTYGNSKIYTQEEIDKAKQSPSFDREYDLKYLGKIGNVFHTKDIEAAIEKCASYDPETVAANPFSDGFGRTMGVDPAYGSSSFGIEITRLEDDQIQMLYANEFQRPDFNHMLDLTIELVNQYQIQNVFIDAANPSFLRALKQEIGDREDYENQIAYYKKMKFNFNWHNHMTVIPVSFNVEHKEMLGYAKMMLEQGIIAIHPLLDKLINSLRTAIAEENSLDKEATSYDDILDAYQLALKQYVFVKDG